MSPHVNVLLNIKKYCRYGKCIRGKNGNMLVDFPGVGNVVIIGKLLRRIDKLKKKSEKMKNKR